MDHGDEKPAANGALQQPCAPQEALRKFGPVDRDAELAAADRCEELADIISGWKV